MHLIPHWSGWIPRLANTHLRSSLLMLPAQDKLWITGILSDVQMIIQ